VGIGRALLWVADRGVFAALASAVALTILAVLRADVPNLDSFSNRSLERWNLFVRGPMNAELRDGLASVADVNAGDNRAVAEYVKAHTPVGAPIFVWGFECIVYDLADRPIASRYIYDVPQRAVWSKEPMRRALMTDLARTPPAAIVVEHNDAFSWVTGDNLDSAGSLWDFADLREMLQRDYDYAARVGHFDVYLRAPAPHAAPSFMVPDDLDDDQAPPG
jgi:hypothetical protein